MKKLEKFKYSSRKNIEIILLLIWSSTSSGKNIEIKLFLLMLPYVGVLALQVPYRF